MRWRMSWNALSSESSLDLAPCNIDTVLWFHIFSVNYEIKLSLNQFYPWPSVWFLFIRISRLFPPIFLPAHKTVVGSGSIFSSLPKSFCSPIWHNLRTVLPWLNIVNCFVYSLCSSSDLRPLLALLFKFWISVSVSTTVSITAIFFLFRHPSAFPRERRHVRCQCSTRFLFSLNIDHQKGSQFTIFGSPSPSLGRAAAVPTERW